MSGRSPNDFSKLTYLKSLHGAGLTTAEYRVLVTILDYTAADGTNAYPGVRRLAKDCEVSEKTVKRCLTSLQQKGFLFLHQRGGRGGDFGRNQASVYQICRPATSEDQRSKATSPQANCSRPQVSDDSITGQNPPEPQATDDPPSDLRSDPDADHQPQHQGDIRAHRSPIPVDASPVIEYIAEPFDDDSDYADTSRYDDDRLTDGIEKERAYAGYHPRYSNDEPPF